MKKLTATIILFALLIASVFAYNTYPSSATEKSSSDCEIAVWEGEIVSPELVATDPDANEGFGPAGTILWTFHPPLTQSGTWETQAGDAGIYETHVTVSDGEFEDDLPFCIEVIKKNTAPVISDIAFEMTVGQIAHIKPQVSDADSKTVYITFQQPIEKEGQFYATTPGVFEYQYSAHDGDLKTFATITITVKPRVTPEQTFEHDHIPDISSFEYIHTSPKTQTYEVEHTDEKVVLNSEPLPLPTQDHVVVGIWHGSEQPKSELKTATEPLPSDTHVVLELTHTVHPIKII